MAGRLKENDMVVNMDMTSDRPGIGENGTPVPAGTKCIYMGHVIGGMVKVRLPDGSTDVVHPHIFPTLR